jgi:hypothetical protein
MSLVESKHLNTCVRACANVWLRLGAGVGACGLVCVSVRASSVCVECVSVRASCVFTCVRAKTH